MGQNDPKLKLSNLHLVPIENESPFDSAVTPWNKHISSSRTGMC